MDPMLSKAIVRNDEVAFKRLIQHDKRVLKRRSAIYFDSALHLASRLGHIEIVTEIVRLCPDLVAEENEKQETPLHAACLSGNVKVVKLLLETNPMAATKLNHENQSAFSLACREGHLDVVKFMLNQSWLMELEEDTVDSNPIYMAASRGRNDIVKEILQVQPNFARKITENGLSPLHCASSRGQLEITKLLLSSNPDLALQYNNYGYTPLHLAVINGYVTILEVFISSSPNSFQCLTKKGETVFHLAVRYNRYNALICLAKVSDFSHLLHQQDRDGNTILHLAVSRENLQLVEFILNTTVDIDCQNDKGQTALDMIEHFGRETENKLIKEMLKTASVDQSMGLSSVAPEVEKPHPEEVQTLSSSEIENTNPEEVQTLKNPKDALEEKIRSLLQSRSKHKLRMMPNPRMDLLNQECLMERMDLPTNPLQHKHLSKSLGRLPTPTIAVTSENGLHNHQSKEKGELEDDSPSEPMSMGDSDVIKFFLNQGWLMDIKEERINLQELMSKASTNIVREILEVWPNFAWKTDKNGCIPLHYTCEKSNLEIARLLLELAPDIANEFNNNGYTPLHLAAMNGDVAILNIFISLAPTSFNVLTRKGESAFHLAVKFGKYASFVTMAVNFRDTHLLHREDQYGNTVLHLAISASCYQLAEYIINSTDVFVKRRNNQGYTALDLLKQARVSSETKRIKDLLVKSGCPESSELLTSQYVTDEFRNELPNSKFSITSSGGDENEQGFSAKIDLLQHKHLSERHRKELTELHKSRRSRQYETQKEALQNARNTIILVAILIATVTFTVGLNPPGGVYQEGTLKGQSTVGRKVAFKIFAISNSIALFTSLCIVIILVSIIPFERKKLMKLMVITHKVMWVAMSFMATAFIAATWVIMPQAHKTRWMVEAILAIGAASMLSVLIFLAVQLVKHWLRKLKWKKQRGKKRKTPTVRRELESQPSKPTSKREIKPKLEKFNNERYAESESSNSDVESAKSLGYHTY